MRTTLVAMLTGLALLIAAMPGTAPPEAEPLVDNPLGDATVVELGDVGADGLFRIYLDITHTGDACTDTMVCGEYAFKVFLETPAVGSMSLPRTTESYSPQINALRDSAELNSAAPGVGRTLDPYAQGFAGNVCGGGKNGQPLDDDGPTQDEPLGNVWFDIQAAEGTAIFLGAAYETEVSQATGNGACSADDTQPTNFPGQYRLVSFSETIVLEDGFSTA